MSAAADTLPRSPALRVERWSSETTLFVLMLLASIAIWAMLLISIIGVIYGLMIALFFFFSHLVFITHIRGSGVRLGPQQFPELWERVVELSHRAGLKEPPEAYVVQAGGSLNAFATKFFRGRMIVLFAELLDACEGDEGARDMVIGHEIGHLKLGHLDWFTLTAPGRFIPLLGAAYSRACEYSCDRWGAALCGDRDGAVRGLAILAAGGKRGREVNLQAFVAQKQSLDTGWMTLGMWLSTYPPLSARIEALDPVLGKPIPHSTKGPTHAAFLLVAIMVLPSVVMMAGLGLWVAMLQASLTQSLQVPSETYDDGDDGVAPMQGTDEERLAKAHADLEAIAAVLREHHAATGAVLQSFEDLQAAWHDYRDTDMPRTDPFDGYEYGFAADESNVMLFSSGPDTEAGTDDDIDVKVAL